MAKRLTSHLRRGILRATRSYHRGGRAGNPPKQELTCNIPSHMLGERTARDADSPDLLEAEAQSNVRLDRMLPRQQSADLNRRRAAALALGAATIAVATRALPRSRAFPKFRVAKRFLPRFPKVVGIPRSRTPATTGVRRGFKGGAFRFPRTRDFPRHRRFGRRFPPSMTPKGRFSSIFSEEGF